MKKIALTAAVLAMVSAPAIADTIHTDGPTGPTTVQSNTEAKQDFASFAATVSPTASTSGKKTNFGGGFIFTPQDFRGGR